MGAFRHDAVGCCAVGLWDVLRSDGFWFWFRRYERRGEKGEEKGEMSSFVAGSQRALDSINGGGRRDSKEERESHCVTVNPPPLLKSRRTCRTLLGNTKQSTARLDVTRGG
jgi:hypothetical protein